MEITEQDVKEVTEAIRDRFDRDVVRRVTMELAVDEDFGDCIQIVVYLDKDATKKDIRDGTEGLTVQVICALRGELKYLCPFVRCAEYIEDNDAAAAA